MTHLVAVNLFRTGSVRGRSLTSDGIAHLHWLAAVRLIGRISAIYANAFQFMIATSMNVMLGAMQ
jgi:hypothetical protein